MFLLCLSLFLFNAPLSPEFYTLSLHDALPICIESFAVSVLVKNTHPVGLCEKRFPRRASDLAPLSSCRVAGRLVALIRAYGGDRKSTRLNSSHLGISYAVFCLKKKKHKEKPQQ